MVYNNNLLCHLTHNIVRESFLKKHFILWEMKDAYKIGHWYLYPVEEKENLNYQFVKWEVIIH